MIKQFYKFLNPKYQNIFLDYKINFQPRYGFGKPSHPELYKIINYYRSDYKAIIEKSLIYKDSIQSIKNHKLETNLVNPTWNNGYLPGLDIIGLYTLLSELKSKKYVEIGSGNSTKVVYKAKKENGLNTEIISIDPKPRVEIDVLTDKIIREPLENLNFDFLFDLEEDDILFIDGSHIILPNSDSMVFYLEILPRLKKGVIVHIHDVYLPYDYPKFMCDRLYNEQYGLAMFILANPKKFTPILPNYFISEDKELSKVIEPIWEHSNLKNVENHGGSFWLKINE